MIWLLVYVLVGFAYTYWFRRDAIQFCIDRVKERHPGCPISIALLIFAWPLGMIFGSKK